MKIGFALPSTLMLHENEQKIFAPKELFFNLIEGIQHSSDTVVYLPPDCNIPNSTVITTGYENNNNIVSIKDQHTSVLFSSQAQPIRLTVEYELDFITQVLRKIKDDQIDLLHVYMSYYSLYLLEQSPIPCLVTLHDPVFPSGTFEFQRLKNSKNIFFNAISERQKELYSKHISVPIIDMIPHGIDIDDYKFHPQAERHFAFAGRYLPEKGVEEAIKTAIMLNLPLHLATSKNYQQNDYYNTVIKNYINNPLITQIAEKIDMNEFFGKARALLFPIKWEEPFGMVLIEAMASGTPVIAFAQGSVPEIVSDNETGYIVNISPDDIRGSWTINETGLDGIGEAVKKIQSLSDIEYATMRRNCRMRVEENFSQNIMVEKYKKLYQKILINKQA